MTAIEAKLETPTALAPPMRLIVLVASCYGLMTVSFVNASHAFWIPSIAADFGIAKAASGALLGCAFWGMVLAMITVGPLADRYGCRAIFVASAFSQSLGMYALSSAGSFGMALTGASLAGLGTGAVMVAASPVIFKLYPDSRQTMAYILSGSFSLGAVLIVAVNILLLSQMSAWRAAYQLIAVLTSVYGLAFIFLPTPPCHSRETVRVRTRTLLLGSRLRLMLASLFVTCFNSVGVGIWLPTYVEQVSKGSRIVGGVGLILNALGSVAASIVGSSLYLRYGSRSVALSSGGITAVAMAIAAVWVEPWIVILCFCVISIGASGIGPVVFARAANSFPEAGATLYSVLHAVANLGCGLGVLAVGAMGQAWGLSTTMLVMSLLSVANLAILAVLLPPHSAVKATTPECRTNERLGLCRDIQLENEI